MVCSKCHQAGHNAKTCLTRTTAPPATAPPPASPPVTPLPSIPPPPASEMKWQDEMIDAIKRNPLEVNWQALSTQYDRTEATLKAMYSKRVSPEEHTDLCVSHFLSEGRLEHLLASKGYNCTSCHLRQYSAPKKWKEDPFCEECHIRHFKEEIEGRWRHLSHYASLAGKDHCTLCHRQAIYNKEIGSRFHFDHINMFEKGESVCMMVMNGTPIEEMEKEIDLCQVVCVSCHSIITEIERNCGFMRLKNNMTREMKKGTSLTNEPNELNKKRYDEMLLPIYEQLRPRWKSSSPLSL